MSRIPIRKNHVTLYAESNEGIYSRTFDIDGVIDSGGSAIAYSAGYNGKGVLKEFFPADISSVSRDEDGRIIYSKNEEKAFKKRLSYYIYPYESMKKLRDDPDIAGFIPPFELFRGSVSENGELDGTVYIWTPQPQSQTFEELCREIHGSPGDRPEYELAQILYAVESLAECADILHRAKLVHCDIKPSNFGFLKRRGNVLYDSISLFDIDTIKRVGDKNVPVRCSDGFTDSEISGGTSGYSSGHDISSDIYSIGAVLYYALITENGGIFRSEYYSGIDDILGRSPLISGLSENLYPGLKDILSGILRRTLGPKNARYQKNSRYKNCGDLLDDIRAAMGFVVPAALPEVEPGKKWLLENLEKYLDKSVISAAVKQHIYEHPLYKNYKNEPLGKKRVSLLIAGLDIYSGKFLDSALQAAQIPGMYLEVTVVSGADSIESYKKKRPELECFFNVNGGLEGDPESYGDINFIVFAPSAEKPLPDIPGLCPDHAFVSAGWSANLSVSRFISERFPECTVSYACIGKNSGEKENDCLIPVYLGGEVSGLFSSELERMGFNTHLVWNDNLNVDFAEKKREYRQAYNHDASTDFALSVKYKLYGAGIDMDGSMSVQKMVERYEEYISDEKRKNELVYLEHRRWAAEKICRGYTHIPDLNDCAFGKPRDEARKRQGCLVRSSRERNLEGGIWRRADGSVNSAAWNDPPEDEFARLCPLEQMSVELHRVYKKNAARVLEEEDLFGGGKAEEIRRHIDTDPEAVSAYRELINCMKNIAADSDGTTGQHLLYGSLKKRFEDSVKNSDIMDEGIKAAVKDLSGSLANIFYPVCASRRFHDYKEEDAKLIERIPFILTYSENICMVMPYISGNVTELFSNLTAPMIVNPGKIIYAAYCENADSAMKIADDMPYIADCMKRKHLHGSIRFFIGIKKGDSSDIADNIKKAGQGKVKSVKAVSAVKEHEFAAAVRKYLLSPGVRKSGDNIIVEMRGIFETSGLFNDFPGYRYDRCRGTALKNVRSCAVAENIEVDPYITVDDMFSFGKAVRVISNDPEFPDYDQLWAVYRRYTDGWKQLCRALKEYSVRNDVISLFRKTARRRENKYSCLIPFACRKTVQSIIDGLIKEGLAGGDSFISRYNTDMCRVSITDIYGYSGEFDRLFSDIHTLMSQDYVSVSADDSDHTVKVIFDGLKVSGLDCTGLSGGCFSVFEDLSKRGYLVNYRLGGASVSFTFASRRIKELLTAEERLLEIFTYHSACKAGGFNDIRSETRIVSGIEGSSENQVDCILTKGFSSVFAECVSAENIMENNCFRELSHTAGAFGINSKAVVVVDGQNIETDKLKKLSDESGVITVYNPKDVDDIGNVLLRIINGAKPPL